MYKQYYTYIMSSNNRTTLYIGVTDNLERRVAEHKSGLIPGFTQRYNCHVLVYYETFSDIDQAIYREKQLKGWKRSKKDALIDSVNPERRDFWQYISMNYFKQKIKAGEVGSSAMPHKVNPIDFENSEGNLGVANALLIHLSTKLPISRLQRDLTDSTVLRNVGVPLAHMMIALASTLKGLRKLLLHRESIDSDLNNCWAVVAEAIQTILRREAYPHPYEALKALTRTNQEITQSTISDFIEQLNVSEAVKEELRSISPQSYTGI